MHPVYIVMRSQCHIFRSFRQLRILWYFIMLTLIVDTFWM